MKANTFSTLKKTLREIQKLQAKSREGVFFQLDFFNGGKGKSSISVKVHHNFNPPQCFNFVDGHFYEELRIAAFNKLKRYIETLQ